MGLDVVDTVLYAVGQNAQFWTLSVADPSSPRPLDSITLPSYDGADVAVIGSTAYASEFVIRTLDVSDPGNLRLVGQADVPSFTSRLVYAEPYLFACCEEGGVCVLETTQAGIQDPGPHASQRMRPAPTIVRGAEWRNLGSGAVVFDAMGRSVTEAKPGVYFVMEAQAQAQAQAVRKIVVTR
jgi:hypothetical protein